MVWGFLIAALTGLLLLQLVDERSDRRKKKAARLAENGVQDKHRVSVEDIDKRLKGFGEWPWA